MLSFQFVLDLLPSHFIGEGLIARIFLRIGKIRHMLY
jgi:hypothetical protein